MRTSMEARKENAPSSAEQREKLRKAIEHKNYEFNCHGVELNQHYRSTAVVSDGTPEPAHTRDPELYYQPTTWPGARLDRKSTRLNSSHTVISYAVFCLKK